MPAPSPPVPERRQRLRDYADLGHRAGSIVQGFALRQDPHAIDDLVEDAAAVGLLDGETVG